jgi:cytochrome c oxidase assembly factor CtaG
MPMLIALVLAALIYLRGWTHLRNANAIAAWRAVSFCGGLLCIWIAAASPLAELDEQLLSVHMVQHLLLMVAAPPLLLLGSPVLPLLHGLPKLAMRGGLGPFLRLPVVHWIGHTFANPVFCWLAATAILIGWHVPSAFALGLASEPWHRVEHASFLTAGLIFWWPVIPSWPGVSYPQWSTVLYLFLATLPCDALSAFLAFCDRVVYPAYLATPRRFDISPLQDQQCAGALMWVCVTFAYLVPAATIVTRLLSRPEFFEQTLARPIPKKLPSCD